jgi:hypothetical protein
MESPRGEEPVEEKTTNERKRETFRTRLVNLLENEIGESKCNWFIECCSALVFFEIWVLLRLGCISKNGQVRTRIQEERPAAPPSYTKPGHMSLRRFATYYFPSKVDVAVHSRSSGCLDELLLESQRLISQLLQSSLMKVSNINDLLSERFCASKILYEVENVIVQQRFSRVETVTVKKQFYSNFNKRIETLNPHAPLFRCSYFRKKNRFALKSYTGVHNSLEKRSIIDPLSFRQAQMNSFFLEAFILMSLDHPKIVKAVDVFIIDEKPCIVLELCRGGSLLDEITQYGVMDDVRVRVVLEQLCDALAYLHSLNIVHGDIKLENIMFKKAGRLDTLALVDFGSVEIQDTARHSRPILSCFGGTQSYQAPEILSGTQSYPSKSSECWSLGILMCVLLTGEFPFPGDTAEEILQSIRQAGNTMVDNTQIDPSLGGLMKSILNVDPNKRPTMHEICSQLTGLARQVSGFSGTQGVANDFEI